MDRALDGRTQFRVIYNPATTIVNRTLTSADQASDGGSAPDIFTRRRQMRNQNRRSRNSLSFSTDSLQTVTRHSRRLRPRVSVA